MHIAVSMAPDAGEKPLIKAYAVFNGEAQYLDPDYSPESVNTVGRKFTKNAWKRLFPAITPISCLLHVFIKILHRPRKNTGICFAKCLRDSGPPIRPRARPPCLSA